MESGGGKVLEQECNRHRQEESTIHRLLGEYVKFLKTILASRELLHGKMDTFCEHKLSFPRMVRDRVVKAHMLRMLIVLNKDAVCFVLHKYFIFTKTSMNHRLHSWS